jgi:hypothetical protein
MNINDLNKHERDALIKFEPRGHKYTCKGERNYTSVTTWLHSHFKPFDADAIIKKMMQNPAKWAKSPYYGQTPEQIKKGWDKNRDEAAAAGTEMHQCIENFYLGDSNTDLPPHFMDFVRDHPHLQPYRTEWMIFDEDIKIAGSIDMVGVAPPDPPCIKSPQEGVPEGVSSLVIYDWKRCKEIKQDNSFKEFASTECIKHLPDTNFWHYSLQLNIYKAILERKYDKKVSGMYLVCLHPNLPTYQLFSVPDLSEEVAALFAWRKKQISVSATSVSATNTTNKSITDYFKKK